MDINSTLFFGVKAQIPYVGGTNGQLESNFYRKLFDIIQLEYTRTEVHNKYEIIEVRESRRYNKAYDPFIFAQQVEQAYYTPYPKGNHCWLVVIKTKAQGIIIDNILSEIEQEAPYQDDDFVGLQVVLHIDPDVINDSLIDIDGGGEEVDRLLLDQTKLDEPNENAYTSSEREIESDFNDTDTS
ncbi:hypothetical protein CR513_22543, partial [Mucuna pruriens]